MAIPDYQTLMLPLLTLASGGDEHKFRETVEALASQYQLSEAERVEMLPSGSPIFDNRVGWARTYLKQAGLIESPKRGVFRITARGTEVLAQNPGYINVAFLDQFDEFRDFRTRRRSKNEKISDDAAEESPPLESSATPEDSLAAAYKKIRNALESDLLEQIKSASPAFFERLVVDLLVKMGYGGSRQDAGCAIGRSGDGGIDGIINEDRLGLDIIYLQAKRWEGTVGRPEIQKFAGVLQGQTARKGVFIVSLRQHSST